MATIQFNNYGITVFDENFDIKFNIYNKFIIKNSTMLESTFSFKYQNLLLIYDRQHFIEDVLKWS